MESKWAKLSCFAAIFGLILNRQINREIKQLAVVVGFTLSNLASGNGLFNRVEQ